MNAARAQVAEYISDIGKQLELQARSVGLDTTAYLLSMVVAETSQAAGQEKPLKKAS
jgi:hypothetical protein